MGIFKKSHPGTILSKLQKSVKSHAKKSVGISNKLLARFARQLCSKDFCGVFSADTIPIRYLAGRGRFIIVVNLAERRGMGYDIPVGHFVTICADTRRIQYLDPFGLPVFHPKVISFLELCRRPVYENRQQIQTLTSVYCGMYCLLFSLYLDRVRNRQPPNFQLTFYKRRAKLKQNDALCISYLKRLIME